MELVYGRRGEEEYFHADGSLLRVFLDVSAAVWTTHQDAEEVAENVRSVHVRAYGHQLPHQVLHKQIDDCTQRLQWVLVGTLLQCVLRLFQ